VLDAISVPGFARGGLIANSLQVWSQLFLSKRVPQKMLTDFYSAAEGWFPGQAQIHRLAFVQKRVINFSVSTRTKQRKELKMIEDTCVGQLAAGWMSSSLIEVFALLQYV
jgi:hypothetical protein